MNNFTEFLCRKWKKILLITVSVLVLICALLTGTILIMKQLGEASLTSTKKASITGENIDGGNISTFVQYEDGRYTYNQDLVNILVLGVDNGLSISREVTPGNLGQTDAIYLVSLNIKTKEIRVLGIPRDTIVPVQIITSENEPAIEVPLQITLQYAYGNNVKAGAKLSAQAVSTLLGNIPIQDVCVINWNTIAVLNDAIGGVTVTIQDTFTDESGMEVDPEFYKGNTVTLKGEQAELFVRERDCNLYGSAMERVSNQEQYIDGFINQAKKQFHKNVFLPFQMYIKMIASDSYYSTLTASEYVYLASQLQGFQISGDDIVTLPGQVEKGMFVADEDNGYEMETGFEEYHVDEKELQELILNYFYIKEE